MVPTSISVEKISPEAQKVLRHLNRSGHKAYLVGGCVRDLLLSRTPKDFDVATDATPSELRELFRNCRIIGRRFRLAHIVFGSTIIETATFRSNPRQEEDDEGGGGESGETTDELYIHRDNVFGTAEQDARRRDFTVNGLFYDLPTQTVLDHVDGLPDLKAHLIRTIGDANVRFREDPVRILRAIKFAARLGFDIEDETYTAMRSAGPQIRKSPPPRVLEEVYRILRGGAAVESVNLLYESRQLELLLPDTAAQLEAEPGCLQTVLHELDLMVQQGQTPCNAVLLCMLVLPKLKPLLESVEKRNVEGLSSLSDALTPVATALKVPRREIEQAKNLFLLQRRILQARVRGGRLPAGLFERAELRPAFGLHALLFRASRRLAGATEAEIETEMSSWPFATAISLGGEAAETTGRTDKGRRPSRRPRSRPYDETDRWLAMEGAGSSHPDRDAEEDAEEAALAAFVAAMQGPQKDD